jgi:hypothetical protein
MPKCRFCNDDVHPSIGQIVAEGWNKSSANPTWHGEIDAINRLAESPVKLESSQLVLYTTAEPCPMCQGAILWSAAVQAGTARCSGVCWSRSASPCSKRLHEERRKRMKRNKRINAIAMNRPNRLFRRFVLLAALVCFTAGCDKSAAPDVDPQPFEAAIARYLDQNNMGVALKDIKAGPTIEGQTATLTASLHHATMGGPAVTWTFRFEQDAGGTWKAVSHK